MSHLPNAFLRASLLTALLLVAPALGAATFGLSPMRVELSAASPTAIVTVTNAGDAPVTIQVQAYDWKQPRGEDAYEETRGFIVSPPIFTLAPGAAQILRVALRGNPPADIEGSYRLIFREVPPPEESASDRAAFRIALNMDIPMFVAPVRGAVAPRPSYGLDAAPDSTMRLRVSNEGTGNLRLVGLRVTQGDERLVEQDVFVVLPGSTRFIALTKGKLRPGNPLRVEAQGNGGRVDIVLPVGKS